MQNIPVEQSQIHTSQLNDAEADYSLTRAEARAQMLAGTASPEVYKRAEALVDSFIRLRKNCKIFDDAINDTVDNEVG
jgi:hypothetical protein